MRLGLSERVAIEAGIYRRDSLTKIAKDTGISRKSLSKEIRQNRTLAPAAKFNGKDCRTLCSAYSPLTCIIVILLSLFSAARLCGLSLPPPAKVLPVLTSKPGIFCVLPTQRAPNDPPDPPHYQQGETVNLGLITGYFPGDRENNLFRATSRCGQLPAGQGPVSNSCRKREGRF